SNCQKCPDNEWPDERKVNCISKTNEFLSYEKEIMGPLFSSISILCSVITIQILGIFICFRDTPIVRANNCILSFLLLVAIMLSFLCVFLFLGRPVDITCILHQVSFGIIFSVAVSSILAKTVMVCIAFKATKPGSFWRKCAGMGVSNCIVLICSSIQVLINVIWLSISPPFLEFDMISYPGKIIIQCNEGSVIAFYLVLGYLGILAAISFVLAFMVRTLPDSFNEAKYITFSMLVFCSVWIAMIPAYLSTKGKYMQIYCKLLVEGLTVLYRRIGGRIMLLGPCGGLNTAVNRSSLEFVRQPQSWAYFHGKTDVLERCRYRCRRVFCHRLCIGECPPIKRTETGGLMHSDNCQKCPDNEWPDENKTKCIPKTYDFLSYENDNMTLVFSLISVLFSLIIVFILGIFILFRDTPIVRANNRNLSFILLVSLMLSFLCVFLFLGRPVDITCMLRQTSFGIIFSAAVSSVLGKTIMVYIAFKATKPGSSWRTWVGVKVSNTIVLICSSIQILINVLWLCISPPFQELDMHSYPGRIIIQCNEGSVIAFFSVLGYMGVLAAVSFIIAYFARTLPDSFNEAKYITFSMLVFCSVWIAMIPAYLSTKGKDMVSVEIFAILTSSAGLLGCIFFPKIYIMLIKPEMNTKRHLLDKIKGSKFDVPVISMKTRSVAYPVSQ
ncbi:vomeronasal type-2 receptor 26-like, partial [Pelobates cultripes]